MSYPTGTSCTACLGVAQPGTRNLMGYLLQRFPWSWSMGIYNCRPVAGTRTLSKHACGEAGDIGVPTLPGGQADTSKGFQIVRLLADHAEALGVSRQIYNRVVYDHKTPRGRYYGGVHPHNDHIHWEQTKEASRDLTYANIVSVLGPPKGEQMPFLPVKYGDKSSDVAAIQALMNRAYKAGLQTDGIYGDRTAQAVAKYLPDSGDPAGKSFFGNRFDDLMWALAVRAAREHGGGSGTDAEARSLAQKALDAVTNLRNKLRNV